MVVVVVSLCWTFIIPNTTLQLAAIFEVFTKIFQINFVCILVVHQYIECTVCNFDCSCVIMKLNYKFSLWEPTILLFSIWEKNTLNKSWIFFNNVLWYKISAFYTVIVTVYPVQNVTWSPSWNLWNKKFVKHDGQNTGNGMPLVPNIMQIDNSLKLISRRQYF
jgi:hypothetical protein